MTLNFEKYAAEGNEFINELAGHLKHPKDQDRNQVARILKAVLHTLRDKITINQSLQLIAQLPMFLKAIYVEQWKYQEKPLKIKTIGEFKNEVKNKQNQYGEIEFDWKMPTEDIIRAVFATLTKYVSSGEMQHILAELPQELKKIFEEKVV